ncbi:hypothetical protein [Micromonospora tulbaghiae]|uniref:hypothetical protein n=1 Tax=Micromonospora tulbaghiae TaxID=479978 RepID=UPI003416BAB6
MAAFVEGLLSVVEWKTCWSLAECAEQADPQAMQRRLCTVFARALSSMAGAGSR